MSAATGCVKALTAREILDSRGRPTVWAQCRLAGGAVGAASVPSGKSTGAAEALELRDGENNRYGGLGCRRAVSNVAGEIARAVAGKAFGAQADFDAAVLALDGTPNKARLGANAILAASIAFARACAAEQALPLYRYFARMIGREPTHLPRMTINLFSGGKHAGGQVAIQDLLIVPAGATTIDAGLAAAYAVFQAAAQIVGERFHVRLLRADEGGLAPPFTASEQLLACGVEAIRATGLRPGADVALAVDVASSHFFAGGTYQLDASPAPALTAAAMIAALAGWADRYPVVSVEDGLAEEDWAHWPALRSALGARADGAPAVLCLGDDFLCTNPARIARAVREKACDALLLKVNQIGTLTEAARARTLAAEAGWMVTVSARSGETEDDWLADLAVGWGADQIKIGSITQSERLAKYNRLLAIEQETRLPVTGWPAQR